MKTTKGRYVGVTFTPEQERARRMWQHANKQTYILADALLVPPDSLRTRDDWHKWLDRRLDHADKIRAEAIALFPDVDESFTISRLELAKR